MSNEKKKRSPIEKTDFIIETEIAILNAIQQGHRCSDDDQFAEARKLVDKYRRDLGLVKKKKKK